MWISAFFLPRIIIRAFQESCNHHSLFMESNRSPYLIFLLDFPNCASPHDQATLPTVPTPTSLRVTHHIAVPRSKFLPCRVLIGTLSQQINPLEERGDFGRGLYLNAVQIVEQHLIQCMWSVQLIIIGEQYCIDYTQ